MLMSHCILTRCKSQSVSALSSGEAELYALVLACSVGLGLKQLYSDLGVELKFLVSMDATGGMAMATRGTAKHICSQYLWVQERIRKQEIEFCNVPTTENLAGVLSKHSPEFHMKYLFSKMGYEVPTSFRSFSMAGAEVKDDDVV